MNRKLALFVILCGGGAAVSIFLRMGIRDPGPASPATSAGRLSRDVATEKGTSLVEPIRQPVVGDREDPGTEPSGVAEVPSQLEAAADPSDEWLFYGPNTRDPIPPAYFDQFYPDELSLEELEEMWDFKGADLRERAAELFDLRYEAGLYEVREQVPLDEWPEKSVAVTRGDGPTLQIRSNWNGDVENAHVLWLPFDEYPDFYQLKDECAYLAHRVVEAKKLVASSNESKGLGSND